MSDVTEKIKEKLGIVLFVVTRLCGALRFLTISFFVVAFFTIKDLCY